MISLWREHKFRKMKDRRDADELVRAHGADAYERALAYARSSDKGSREERHWARIAKVIKSKG